MQTLHFGYVLLIVSSLITGLSGCGGSEPTRSASKVSAPLLTPGLLTEHGLGFLTPTAASSREEDRHALALVFGSVFAELRPEVRIVPLAQTLGAVNRAGMLRQYQRMYEGYAAAGVLERDTLAKLRGVTGVRYFCLLQLGEFSQPTPALQVFPLPARNSPPAHIRLFVQIWDSVDGTVAWEGINEISHAAQTGNAGSANFSVVVERAARELIGQLP